MKRTQHYKTIFHISKTFFSQNKLNLISVRLQQKVNFIAKETFQKNKNKNINNNNNNNHNNNNNNKYELLDALLWCMEQYKLQHYEIQKNNENKKKNNNNKKSVLVEQKSKVKTLDDMDESNIINNNEKNINHFISDFEIFQIEFISLLLNILFYLTFKISKKMFLEKYEKRIFHILFSNELIFFSILPPKIIIHYKNEKNNILLFYQKSLSQRAAKSFMELQIKHKNNKNYLNKNEFELICEILSNKNENNIKSENNNNIIASLPLFYDNNNNFFCSLLRMTNWKEKLWIIQNIQKKDKNNKNLHFFSKHILELLIQISQSELTRNKNNNNETIINELILLWEKSQKNETKIKNLNAILNHNSENNNNNHISLEVNGRRISIKENNNNNNENNISDNNNNYVSGSEWNELLLQGNYRMVLEKAETQFFNENFIKKVKINPFHHAKKKMIQKYSRNNNHNSFLSESEKNVLLCPPSKGLNILDKYKKNEKDENLFQNFFLFYELRMKLEILAHLPNYISKRLILFEGDKTIKNNKNTFFFPYLVRNIKKETLPWLMIAKINEIYHNNNNWKKEMLDFKNKIEMVLFSFDDSYASFFDFVSVLLVELGAGSLRSINHKNENNHNHHHHHFLQEAVFLLLEPPAPSFYNNHNNHLHNNKNKKELLLFQLRNYHFSLYVETLLLSSEAQILKNLKKVFEKENKIHQNNNKNEIHSIFAPETAVVLLTAIILQFYGYLGNHYNNPNFFENKEKLLLLFLKELHFIFNPNHKKDENNHNGPFFHFAATADKKNGNVLFSYFKSIYHESFFELLETFHFSENENKNFNNTIWNSPAALLIGRRLRLMNKYPSTTTDRFFKIYQNNNNHNFTVYDTIPSLNINLYKVNLKNVLFFFFEKFSNEVQNFSKINNNNNNIPFIIGSQLPFCLSAVYKPENNYNCTINSKYYNLIAFLAVRLPLFSENNNEKNENKNTILDISVPVLHQHALVNRIDRSTSGIVLISHSENHENNNNNYNFNFNQSIKATLIDRAVYKEYYAIVQHLPCYQTHHFNNNNNNLNKKVNVQSLLNTEIHYLSAEGTITDAVYAEGTSWHQLSLNPHQHHHARDLEKRPAITRYRVLQFFPKQNIYLIQLSLHSGRRHQIRQHLAMIGFPLLGDERYHPWVKNENHQNQNYNVENKNKNKNHNNKKDGVYWANRLERAALHASKVIIVGNNENNNNNGNNNNKTIVQCEMAADMREVLEELRESNFE